MPDESDNSVVLSSYILHRALCIEDEASWKTSRYLFDTLYLAILLEHFVLHDQLLVSPITNIESHPEHGYEVEVETFMSERFRESDLLGGLAESGALIFNEASFDSQMDEQLNLMHEHGVDDVEELDPYVASDLREIRFAFRKGFSFIPDYSRSCIDAMSRLEKQRVQQTSLLAKTYDDITTDFRQQIQRLVDAGSDRRVYIPPIPAIILDRATSASDICRRALELREEFTDLRTTFRQYEYTIRDDSLSLGESMNALDELERSVAAASPRTSAVLETRVSEWRDLTDSSKWLDGISTSEAGGILKIAAGTPLKIAATKLRARRVSYLSRMCKQFMKITNYGTLLERVLKHPITSEHVEHGKTARDDVGLSDYLF